MTQTAAATSITNTNTHVNETLYGEQAYLSMLSNILDQGVFRKPDDEEGRYELFAQPLKFDLRDWTLPLMTTKKTMFKSLAAEMLWFLSGSSKVDFLHQNDVHIWDTWANKDGEVGPLYGYQWRHWHVDPKVSEQFYGGATEIDQFANVMKTLAERPEARSHMVTAWRPDHLKAMSIKPCHILLQFYRVDNEVSLAMYQRSCDSFLGVPFNIAQYSLLTHMVAHQLGCTAKEFTWIGGDVHIYENHVEQVREQLTREILSPPTLKIKRKPNTVFDYQLEDFEVLNYEHASYLKGDISAQGQPGKGVGLETVA